MTTEQETGSKTVLILVLMHRLNLQKTTITEDELKESLKIFSSGAIQMNTEINKEERSMTIELCDCKE